MKVKYFLLFLIKKDVVKIIGWFFFIVFNIRDFESDIWVIKSESFIFMMFE